MYYINNFFIYSILGHIIETFVYIFHKGESGILYGKWTPIYGIGVILILLVYKFFESKKIKKSKKNLYIFLVSAIFLTIVEYIGGVLIEKIFGYSFWTYEGLPLNIGKYISIEMAIVWGICSLVFIKFLKPLSDRIVKKIPRFISWILIVIFVIDLIITII